MPKGYQISQYDRPLCFDGAIDIPQPLPADQQKGGSIAVDYDGLPRRIGVIRAHLEEDAGKLLHEAPGGGSIDYSIVDLNRAGTALLEVVTQPDFETAEQVVVFCQTLRDICRFLGASEGVLQKGHMRFEPNINCHLTLSDGHLVKTPIVEVKNLNSFKAVRAAVEFERREQPQRWLNDGRVMGPGAKQTRGWDDHKGATYVMREKEDAHDYRYFPDPDLLPVAIDEQTVARLRDAMPQLPMARLRAYVRLYALPVKDAAALSAERSVSDLYESAVAHAVDKGVSDTRAGKAVANLLLQSGAKRANERSVAEAAFDAGEPVFISSLGITARAVGALAALRESGAVSAAGADELFGVLCEPGHRAADPAALAAERGLLVVKDDAAIDSWVQQAIDANPQAAADVRAGKEAAVGRIVGAAAKISAGKADAADLRKRIMVRLGRG